MDVSPLCERLKQYKMTTPPWKETFRKECMNRIRNNRRRLMDENRRGYMNDIVMEEWTKLRENYDDIDVHLSIYEEIKKEMDEEADRIFEEYEKSVNFPSTSHQDGGDVANYLINPNQRLIRCAACGRKHDYNIASQFPNDNGHLVSFCVCGHLTVDKRTKVLEPAVSGEEICQRILSTVAGHAAVCSSAPFVHTVDNDNDGTQLIMFCQACGMQLVIW